MQARALLESVQKGGLFWLEHVQHHSPVSCCIHNTNQPALMASLAARSFSMSFTATTTTTTTIVTIILPPLRPHCPTRLGVRLLPHMLSAAMDCRNRGCALRSRRASPRRSCCSVCSLSLSSATPSPSLYLPKCMRAPMHTWLCTVAGVRDTPTAHIRV
ncbi:hypothetical protein BKA80DRAFT_111767 [Phyllosticta citrichinensis]